MLTFNRNSWHYKAAKFHISWISLYEDDEINLCEYTRWVLAGCLKVILAIGFGLLALYSIVDALAWLIVLAINSVYFEPNMSAKFGLTIFIMSFVLLVILFIIEIPTLTKRLWRKIYKPTFIPTEKKPDSFLKAQYKRFKNKVCFNITFTG